MNQLQILKYPRTQHIEGSRLQPDDEDLDAVPFSEIAGRHVVIEEKMDGANCGISFSAAGELRLQSRGHYLTGGPREKHFTLFKQWAAAYTAALWDRLGDRYVLYGEWLYAKHTIFYDALPHYLMEFDLFDTRDVVFLDTPRRAKLLVGVPLPQVKVLFAGTLRRLGELTSLVGPSHYMRDGHLERLRATCERLGLDADRAVRETDRTNLMEGLYIKIEEGAAVTGRYKFVRADFLTAVFEAEGHWLHRPIIPNQLCEGVDLFGGKS